MRTSLLSGAGCGSACWRLRSESCTHLHDLDWLRRFVGACFTAALTNLRPKIELCPRPLKVAPRAIKFCYVANNKT